MSDFRFGADDYGLDYYPHDVLNEDDVIDWSKVESVEIDWVTFVRKRDDSPSATDAVREFAERYEKRIAKLEQKVEDLQGMLGQLPPEGKCAMLIVRNEDGEYIWASEPFDFASYIAVDLDADTYTSEPLCDPFGKADHADELTMADTLREAAARLDEQGDSLGVIGLQRNRIAELESEIAELREGFEDTIADYKESDDRVDELEQLVCDMYADFQRIFEGGRRLDFEGRMAELGLGD